MLPDGLPTKNTKADLIAMLSVGILIIILFIINIIPIKQKCEEIKTKKNKTEYFEYNKLGNIRIYKNKIIIEIKGKESEK